MDAFHLYIVVFIYIIEDVFYLMYVILWVDLKIVLSNKNEYNSWTCFIGTGSTERFLIYTLIPLNRFSLLFPSVCSIKHFSIDSSVSRWILLVQVTSDFAQYTLIKFTLFGHNIINSANIICLTVHKSFLFIVLFQEYSVSWFLYLLTLNVVHIRDFYHVFSVNLLSRNMMKTPTQ